MIRNRVKGQRISKKGLSIGVTVIVVMVLGVTIAYAASLLTNTLDVTINKVTQNALSWNVAFQTGSVNATPGGSSDSTGRSCGVATVTADTATVAASTLSKPGDSCTYALSVRNTGDINAILSTITPISPASTQCDTNGATMVCGNITYKLAINATGSPLLNINSTLPKTNRVQPIYLIIEYTGATTSTTAVQQASGGFTLVYTQN